MQEFVTAYGPHLLVRKEFKLPSLTQQSQMAATDINKIMARFEKTGIAEHLNEHQGRYGDFTGIEDYQTCLNQIMSAQATFASLPSRIRGQFDNDAGKFLDFATNPANLDELREMGLAKPLQTNPNGPPGPEEPPAGTPAIATPPATVTSEAETLRKVLKSALEKATAQ